MSPSREVGDLLALMARLRAPGTGCPWDLAQTFETIAPYTVEEAYEVADAIQRGDLLDLRDELGDLLLQVVFHARIAEERGAFAFPDVVEAISAKLIRRHPHVFGSAGAATPDEVRATWETIKAEERVARREALGAAEKGAEREAASLLAGVATALPALARAVKLQGRAAAVGFDWPDARPVLAKVREEADEVEAALASGIGADVAEEIGDLLFAVVNLARHAGVDPEASLAAANRKFTRRFGHIERALGADGRSIENATLDEMESLWTDAKTAERWPG